MQVGDVIQTVIAARDTGLIGHNNNEVTSALKRTNRFGRTINKLKVCSPVKVFFFDIDCAVTVEKDGTTCRLSGEG